MHYKKHLPLRFFVILLAITISLPGRSNGQSKVLGVKEVIAKINDNKLLLPAEKLHLFFDKPNYIAGDTIWFKTVLINASNRLPSALSNKVYVELLNDSSRLVERLVIPLTNGTGNGDFKLPPQGLTDGAYTIRAYTNWMQNFGEEAFFHKRFYIVDDGKNPWLIKEQHTIKTTPEGKSVALTMQFTDMHNMPLPYKDMQVFLVNGGKTIYKQAFLTSDQGDIAANFNLPADVNTRNLKMVVRDGSNKKKTQVFPFYPGVTAQSVDVQFMPEGGEIVAGLLNKIAFKAIGDDGLGVNISGVVVDGKGAEVATFRSTHNGMGNFRLVPLPNAVYKARINYNGDVKEIPLPAVKASGIALRVDNVTNPGEVKLFVTATPDLAGLSKTYMLIAQGKDSVYLGYAFDLNKGYFNLTIPAGKFATGVISFSILNEGGKPLSERRVFMNNNDNLVFKLSPHKIEYQPKDSVAVQIEVLRSDGSPVKNGSFAVAVTDDGQVKLPQYAPTILTDMLLASEIKGYIEEPGWYFNATNANASKALDDLMLTQGWTGFNWNGFSTLAVPRFEADFSNHISGKLSNLFNKPISGAKVRLFSTGKYGTILADTLSDQKGEFNFTNLPLVDSIAYTITAYNSKGKQIPGAIMLNEFTAAPVTRTFNTRLMPWYVNSTDSPMLKTLRIKQPPPLYGLKPGELKGNILEEVTIKSLKNAVFFDDNFGYPMKELDERQLIAQRKKTLLDVLKAQFRGFNNTYMYSINKLKPMRLQRYQNFAINAILLLFYIDGVNILKTQGPWATGRPESYYEFLNMYLNYVTATEVKHIQVFSGDTYIMNITTRSGAGPWLKMSNNTAIYRPLVTYIPRQFYAPRYTASNTHIVDNRSTIHWEPNLITDENGKATLSFYTADKPSTYTLSIEGTDMIGRFGAQTLNIKVDAKPTASK